MPVESNTELLVRIQNLQAENWKLKEANKALQKQADMIATLKVRYGSDTIDSTMDGRLYELVYTRLPSRISRRFGWSATCTRTTWPTSDWATPRISA